MERYCFISKWESDTCHVEITFPSRTLSLTSTVVMIENIQYNALEVTIHVYGQIKMPCDTARYMY